MNNVRILISETASDVYNSLVFNDADDLYNKPAPEPEVTFIIGAVLSAVSIVLWYWRFRKIRRAISKEQWTTSLALRGMISAAIDNDSPSYTIAKLAAQSFLFLAGIQLNYGMSFLVMLLYFTFESSLDTWRTMLSFFEYKDFDDLVVTSNSMRSQIKKTSTQLTPTNVYEDLSRDQYIVIMVFVTQSILISFVVSCLLLLSSSLVGVLFSSRLTWCKTINPSLTLLKTTGGGHFPGRNAFLSRWHRGMSRGRHVWFVVLLRAGYFHGVRLFAGSQDVLWSKRTEPGLLDAALALHEGHWLQGYVA